MRDRRQRATGDASVAAVSNQDVLLGGMPPVHLGRPANPALWLKGYEQNDLGSDAVPRGDRLWAVPLDLLLS